MLPAAGGLISCCLLEASLYAARCWRLHYMLPAAGGFIICCPLLEASLYAARCWRLDFMLSAGGLII